MREIPKRRNFSYLESFLPDRRIRSALGPSAISQTLLTRYGEAGYRVIVMLRRAAIRSESGGCVLNKPENT
jgi:hypothetical protein